MKKLLLWCVPALMLFLAGCSSSRLTTSWVSKDLNGHGSHFNKVLVLGMLSAKNRAVKVNMENQLATGLNNLGIETVTATEVYGPKAFRNKSEEEVLSMLKEDGIDGVVTIAMVDKNAQRRFVPGYYGAGPYYFWNYYSFYSPFMWGAPYGGYYERTTSYSFETNLYDLKDRNKMLYSAQSETIDPSSPEKLAVDFSKTILKDLNAKHILQ